MGETATKLTRIKTFGVAISTNVVLCLAMFLTSQAEQVVTIEQAVAIALAHNPSLAAARNETAATQYRITQSRSAYLPQVILSGSYDHSWAESGESGMGGTGPERNAASDRDTLSTSLSVSQYLYDFGSTRGQLDQSLFNAQASEYGLVDISKNLVRNVKVAYFEALKKERLIAVNQEDLDVRQRHLEQAKALVDQGMQPRIDVLRSETEVSRSRLQLVQAKYNLSKARVGLEKLWGRASVQGSYSLTESVDPPWSPSELQPLLDQALDGRVDIAQLKAQINSAEAALQQAKGGAWPSLNANGNYRYSGEDYPLDKSWGVGVDLRWELFTGLSRSAQISEKKVLIRRLEALLQSQEDSVFEQVTQAFLAVQEARDVIDNARTGLKQATENLAMAQGRYKAGVSNSLEFFDAQILYTEAKSTLVQAEYGHHQASATLEYAVGVITVPPSP